MKGSAWLVLSNFYNESRDFLKKVFFSKDSTDCGDLSSSGRASTSPMVFSSVLEVWFYSYRRGWVLRSQVEIRECWRSSTAVDPSSKAGRDGPEMLADILGSVVLTFELF